MSRSGSPRRRKRICGSGSLSRIIDPYTALLARPGRAQEEPLAARYYLHPASGESLFAALPPDWSSQDPEVVDYRPYSNTHDEVPAIALSSTSMPPGRSLVFQVVMRAYE